MQAFVDIWERFLVWGNDYFLNTFKTIRFIDVLDILILALVFYYVYRFIRDRRAGKHFRRK